MNAPYKNVTNAIKSKAKYFQKNYYPLTTKSALGRLKSSRNDVSLSAFPYSLVLRYYKFMDDNDVILLSLKVPRRQP